MSIDAEIILHIEKSETEEDIKENLISDFNDVKNILDYYKDRDKEVYQKMLKEYQDLRQVTKTHVDSLNKITKNELQDIKNELNDIYETESTFDKITRTASTFLDDKIRTKREIKKEVIENYNEALKYTQSLPDTDYKKALLEELETQKKEFDNKYAEHLTKAGRKKYANELEQEALDIQLLNEVRGIASALWEGSQYYNKANELLDKEGSTNLKQAEDILHKMNLIYLAAKANNVAFTGEFKEKRDDISLKIANKKKNIFDNKEEENLIVESKFLGYVPINITKVESLISSNNYQNIEPTELFYYIKNKIGGNFAINGKNTGVEFLLKNYNRDFIKHLSNTLAKEGSSFSAIIKEEGGKKFLIDLKEVKHILNLNNISDLNHATDDLSKESIEYTNAETELKNPELRKKFLETISNDPSNLNKYLQELKVYAIQEELKNIAPQLKKQLLTNEPNLNNEEITERLKQYENDVLNGIKEGLKGNNLIQYLIEKGYSPNISKTIINASSKGLENSNDILIESYAELRKLKSKTHKLIKGIEDEILNNEEFSDTAEKISLLKDEDFEILRDKLSLGETFEEIDEYFSENNEEYKKLLEKQAIKNSVIDIDFGETQSPIYQDFIVDTSDSKNNFIISKDSSKKIVITTDEAKTIKNNPDALKNIIEFKEKLDLLGLSFIWEHRNKYIESMKNTDGFKDIKMNTNDDFINIDEFNHVLRYAIHISGGTPSGTYSSNIANVIRINEISATNNTRNGKGLSNIESKFNKAGFLTKEGTISATYENLRNYSPVQIT